MSEEKRAGGVAPGIVLVATTVLAVVGMLHHPTGGGRSGEELADSLARVAGMSKLVHGAMIGAEVLLLYALAAHAVRRGLERPAVLAGLVAYGVGAIAMIPPPIIDGFVIPDLALRAQSDAEMRAVLAPLIAFAFGMAIAFAKLASALISAGVVFFSIDLLHERGAARWVGGLGVAIGVAAGAAVVSGVVALDARGMTAIVIAWSVWYAALGVLLVLKKA